MKTHLEVGDMVLVTPKYYYQEVKFGEVLKVLKGLIDVNISTMILEEVPETHVVKLGHLVEQSPLGEYELDESNIKNLLEYRDFFKNHFIRSLKQLEGNNEL